MKPLSLFFLMIVLPAISFCQSVTAPSVKYAEDNTTTITKIQVTRTNTIVTFKHILPNVGAWVELNKSIYLQDADGEQKYQYIKSEGITLFPKKTYAKQPNQELVFKVYFAKLKPGTKNINIIERARSPIEQMSSNRFFNYYGVSLTKSGRVTTQVKVSDIVLSPPPPMITDTVNAGNKFDMTSVTQNMAPMMAQMYSGILNAQLKMYSDTTVTDKLARITKNYFDALIKVGFSADAALKIVTSKQLISTDLNKQ